MKVMFISPQVIGAKEQIRKATPPLGPAYLAASLERDGHEAMIIDTVVEGYDNIVPLDERFIRFGMPNSAIIKKINEFKPDIVGISVLFSSQTECGVELAREIKQHFSVPVIFGGNHFSFVGEEIMANEPAIDFVLTGESDYTFLEFLRTKNAPGLIWRKNGKTCRNPNTDFIRKLDDLPFPAWHLLNMEGYFRINMPHNPFVKSNRVGSVLTSRGCPYKCYFCSTPNYSGVFRPLSAKRAIELINDLVEKLAIKELQILDDDFTVDYKRVIEICAGIKKLGLRICLPNAIRADLPKDKNKRLDMFKVMRECGVEQVGIGIESGDQEFSKTVIRKNLDLREPHITCDLLHSVGCLVHATFMMGFPFETAKNRQKTIEYAKSLDADSYSVSLAAPLPGTQLWKIAKENNLFLPSFNINRMVLTYPSIKPADISAEELYQLAENLNRELNRASLHKRPANIEKYKLMDKKIQDRKFCIEAEDSRE